MFDYCSARGILPLCTPWDPRSGQLLNDYGVEAFKVMRGRYPSTEEGLKVLIDEKFLKPNSPDGKLMSKCGPGQPVGPLYKDRMDCETKYMMASAGARACSRRSMKAQPSTA